MGKMGRNCPDLSVVTPHNKRQHGSESLWDPPEGKEDLTEAEKRIAVPTEKACRTHGCDRTAADRNFGYCPFHSKGFVPKDGSLCLDVSFMRSSSATSSSGRLCDCGLAKCRAIGYPNQGLFAFPADFVVSRDWCEALKRSELQPNTCQKKRLAWWHFLSEHLTFDPVSGHYVLKKDLPNFKDAENKTWKCGSPPLRSLAHFVADMLGTRAPPRQRLRILSPCELAEHGESFTRTRPGSAGATTATAQKTTTFAATVPIATVNGTPAVTPAAFTKLKKECDGEHRARLNAETQLANAKALYSKESRETAEHLVELKDEATTEKKKAQKLQTLLDSSKQELAAVTEKSQRDLEKEHTSTETELMRVRRECLEQIRQADQNYQRQLRENQDAYKEKLAEKENEIVVLRIENEELREHLRKVQAELDAAIEAAQSLRRPLRYSDFLDPNGKMYKHAGAFFPLRSIELVEKFLDIINVKRNDSDPGVCSRLRRHDYVTRLERDGKRTTETSDTDGSGSGDGGPLRGLASGDGRKGRPRNLHWKDEFLVYSCFHYGGLSFEQIHALLDVLPTTTHSCVHQYANYLDMFFARTMPNPTKDQIRKCYPDAFISTFHHAMIPMLLDCTDQEMEDPRSRFAHAVLWSQYHQQTGGKAAVGCTPIGTVPHPWCSNVYPSSITDPNIVTASGIVKDNLEKGDMVEVDKGILIENQCALLGIRVMRPTTMRHKQKQQGCGDTQKTQEVGNTRILIEQVNRQGKSEFRLWHHKFPLLSKDVMSQLMRIGFMFANFKPAFIIGRDGL